ncbi:hypothetical protein [Streptomyces sp. A1547]|uniref:hypothetical protein n=1 Tax=Streptomyces sp. A1547 TaxID=2563105 RepID=UPI00109E926B|nr:hypothetical protein [Streptomyces sp. A1547]THA38106.1 hypothetical protein E6W17_16600 [Streptomyces sp. A1547]
MSDPQPQNPEPSCNHLFAHPQTPQQRKRVEAALENARLTGDAHGVLIAVAQLTGPCDVRDGRQP